MATNPVEIFSAGVYGFEKAPESGPENISPAKLGLVGWTDEGPSHLPIEVGSVEEFSRIFGGVNNKGELPIQVRGFFALGGERAVIVRVTPGDSVAATVTADSKFSFTAKGEGLFGNALSVRIRGNANFLDRTSGAEKWNKFDIIVIGPSPADPTVSIGKETFEAVQLTDADLPGFLVDVMSDPNFGSGIINVAEVTAGVPSQLLRDPAAAEAVADGDGTLGPYSGTLSKTPLLSQTLSIYHDRTPVAGETFGAAGTPAGGTPHTMTAETLVDGPSLKRGTLVITYEDAVAAPFTITDDPTSEVDGVADLIDSFDSSVVGTIDYESRTFTFTTAQNTNVTPVEADYTPQYYVADDGLGFFDGDVDPSTTNTINYETGAWILTFDDGAAKGGPFADPVVGVDNIEADYVSLPLFADYDLTGGLDGSAVSRSAISAVALEPLGKGIYALDTFDQPLNLSVPDFEGSQTVQADIVAFCEARADNPTLKNRIFLQGFANGTTVAEAVKYVTIDQAGVLQSKVVASYYNNVRYRRDDGVVETVSVTGFVGGIFSRTAQTKNVGRAPAGIGAGLLNGPGIIGPEFNLSRPQMDTLYQVNINPVIRTDASGYIINGARTLSNDPRWRFVNTRTLNDFLMFRIDRILQFAVFENNGPSLWARAEAAVSGFMTSLFRLGFFGGNLAEEAFFVKVDGSNNDRESNTLNIDVGFTAGTPTEFVIFRVQQPVGQTSLT